MTTASAQPPSSRQQRSIATTLVLVALVVGYTLLQPRLEEWSGTDLPSLVESPVAERDNESPVSSGNIRSTPEVDPSDETAGEDRGEPAEVSFPPMEAGGTSSWPSGQQSGSQTSTETPTSRNSEQTRRLGELRDIGGKVFKSTAGLYYRPGSQEGHRINHILRHHEDDLDRPVHGVFDGDRNEVFAVIDEAYLYTFDHGPPRVTTEKEDGRTIYRVDLERRIGYVGGQSGRRQGHPPARHVQLILDGANVITAYPVRFGRQRD